MFQINLDCTKINADFKKIHSLYTGGAHSRLLVHIAGPTSPLLSVHNSQLSPGPPAALLGTSKLIDLASHRSCVLLQKICALDRVCVEMEWPYISTVTCLQLIILCCLPVSFIISVTVFTVYNSWLTQTETLQNANMWQFCEVLHWYSHYVTTLGKCRTLWGEHERVATKSNL